MRTAVHTVLATLSLHTDHAVGDAKLPHHSGAHRVHLVLEQAHCVGSVHHRVHRLRDERTLCVHKLLGGQANARTELFLLVMQQTLCALFTPAQPLVCRGNHRRCPPPVGLRSSLPCWLVRALVVLDAAYHPLAEPDELAHACALARAGGSLAQRRRGDRGGEARRAFLCTLPPLHFAQRVDAIAVALVQVLHACETRACAHGGREGGHAVLALARVRVHMHPCYALTRLFELCDEAVGAAGRARRQAHIFQGHSWRVRPLSDGRLHPSCRRTFLEHPLHKRLMHFARREPTERPHAPAERFLGCGSVPLALELLAEGVEHVALHHEIAPSLTLIQRPIVREQRLQLAVTLSWRVGRGKFHVPYELLGFLLPFDIKLTTQRHIRGKAPRSFRDNGRGGALVILHP
mmetsp:Transcript_42272/g.99032  ORF Transcript_42272/g.99032 Transcript_42272/m.99032 type:complete len:405 (+) Transcript_42272:44-1258(+)